MTTYCYDQANRLVSATTPGGDAWAYRYDVNGNRTETRKNGAVVQTLTVNRGDQITTAGYGHDASGNTTAAPSVGSSVAYNGAEQMTARTSGGSTAGYTYAGTDQVELIAQSGGRDYTYGRSNGAGVPIIESYRNGITTTSYTYDPQGTPLAVEGANSHYLALDGLGSPVALVNHSGGHTVTYTYDPYGQATATAVNGSGAIGIQVYGYAGGFDDPASTLVHFGQRWYDPATGRFTQQDALETLADPTRANRYQYANGDPVKYVDPTGLFSFLEAVGEVAGTALIVATGAVGGLAGGVISGGNPVGIVAGAAAGAAIGGCAAGAIEENFSNAANNQTGSTEETIAACAVGSVTALFT